MVDVDTHVFEGLGDVDRTVSTAFIALMGSYLTRLSPEETLPAKMAASVKNTGTQQIGVLPR